MYLIGDLNSLALEALRVDPPLPRNGGEHGRLGSKS